MTLPVRPPVKPMLAKLSEEMPRGEGWIYEPKWDGFRAVIFRDGSSMHIASRNDRPLNRYFPEVEALLHENLPERCVVDGEIILPSPDGLEFEVLQLRLHPAASRVNKLAAETPASFVAFDLLSHEDEDLMSWPLTERLDRLATLFGVSRPKVAREPATKPGPAFYLTPCTDDADVAADWFDDLEKVGLDGVMAKRLDTPYLPGERAMVKIKHRRTADCVIVGYRAHKHGGIGSLLLGLYDKGELRFIGHTSALSAAARKEFLELLEPMRIESPHFEGEWGPGGQSRWSAGREEQEWVAVEPKLVCEVSYDFMQSGYRFRHASRLLRMRDDKKPEECTFDQVAT
jgi:ATP-dependent DNA ligase